MARRGLAAANAAASRSRLRSRQSRDQLVHEPAGADDHDLVEQEKEDGAAERVAAPYQPNHRPTPEARPRSARRWAEDEQEQAGEQVGQEEDGARHGSGASRPRRCKEAKTVPRSNAIASPAPTGDSERASCQVGGACHTRMPLFAEAANRPAMAPTGSAPRHVPRGSGSHRRGQVVPAIASAAASAANAAP